MTNASYKIKYVPDSKYYNYVVSVTDIDTDIIWAVSDFTELSEAIMYICNDIQKHNYMFYDVTFITDRNKEYF